MNSYDPNRQNPCINTPKSNYDLAFSEAQFLFASRINSVSLRDSIEKWLLALADLDHNGNSRLEYISVFLRDYIETIKTIHPLIKTEMSSFHHSFVDVLQEHLAPHVDINDDCIDTLIQEIQNINNVNPPSYH